MLPRLHRSKLVSAWITLTLFASIVAAIDGGWLARWTAFAPARIWHGELWRLVTWVVVERDVLGLILTCASIHKFGGELAPRWGDRRLWRFAIEVIGGAAIVAAVLAFLDDDAWYMARHAGWVVGDALVIAWARQYPDSTLTLYGLLQLRGRDLIAVSIGITALYAIFVGVFRMAPELLVCAAALWYPASRLGRGSLPINSSI